MSLLFNPIKIRGITFNNRIFVSPMCQYSAVDGVPSDWHILHLGSFAASGIGLLIAEATGVEDIGRITLGCPGLYNDEQEESFSRIFDIVTVNLIKAGEASGKLDIFLERIVLSLGCYLTALYDSMMVFL